jgi:hypothetical protein
MATSPTPPVTPTMTRRELIDYYLQVISVASRNLDRLPYEEQDRDMRSAMCGHVNLKREERGYSRVGLDSVARAHQAAIGHSDFAVTFAIGCADLTLNSGKSARDECPQCGSEIVVQWSGVKCANDACTWWYCR